MEYQARLALVMGYLVTAQLDSHHLQNAIPVGILPDCQVPMTAGV